MAPCRVLTVALLLVLAGCSGLVPADDGTDRTPYGVDDELEPAPDTLAPGLTSEGVENASALIENHYDVLENRTENDTHVATVRTADVTENGTAAQRSRGRFVVDSPDRWYRTVTQTRTGDAEPTVLETWVEGDEQLVRVDRPQVALEYRRSPPPKRRPLERVLRSVLSEATNATVEERTRNATNWYLVTAAVESGAADAPTVTFRVREDGFVAQLTYAYRFDEDSPDRDHVETRIEFEPDGPDPLERPDWYEEALEETRDEEAPDDEGSNEEEETDDEETPDGETGDEGTDDEGTNDEH